jgi:lipoprotein NlpI
MFSLVRWRKVCTMIRFSFLALTCLMMFAAENPPANPPLEPYKEAIVIYKEAAGKGLFGKALEALDRAIKLDPTRYDAYFYRAGIYSAQNKPEAAVEDYSKVIQLDPKASTAYNNRGWEQFKLNKMDRAIEDFDRYIQLEPKQEPYHWQRGIAYYYAGKYDLGRKQFELHQTVNPHDFENGVWHFMCVARESGFDKARESMIAISGDYRVPMSEIYELFRGKATPDDVLKAAKKGNPSETELEARRFYAELYLGLYFEAKGDKEKAYEHIKRAATQFRADHLMGDVARVHFKRLIAPPGAK